MPAPIDESPQAGYIVDVLLVVATGSTVSRDSRVASTIRPPTEDDSGEPMVVPVLLSTLQGISHIRIHMPKDLRPLPERQTVLKAVKEVKKRFPKGITLLDPVENMGIKDESFKKLIKKISLLEKRLVEIPIASAPNLPEIYDLHHTKIELGNSVRALKKKIQSVQNILQLDELKGRKRVLRRLGFTSADDVVEMKGRVACEISSGDELLLTEMIFGGVFNGLEPAHCAALLSCFVFGEKVCCLE